MGFNKFKGLFVEEDIKVSKQPAQKSVLKVNASTMADSYPTQPTAFPSKSAMIFDPQIGGMLRQSLEENKLAGFDYLKFVSAVEEMKSTGASEDQRFKMAFMTAKQLGVDKGSLSSSGQHYLDVLKQDESDFNSDCAQHVKTEVQAREKKLAQIEDTITSLAKQLAQLQQDQQTLKSELESERSTLDSRQAAFQATLGSIRSDIENNLQKINQYL